MIHVDMDGNGLLVALIGNHNGAVDSCVIKAEVSTATSTTKKGLSLQLYKTGTWSDIAFICTSLPTSYTNRGGLKKVTGAQLNNVVRYTSIENFISATGSHWTTEQNEDGTWTSTNVLTPITEPQDIGSAWTIDATGIKLNGNYVYSVA